MSRRYVVPRIRGRIRTIKFDEAYRLIHRKYRERPLGAVPAPSRFSDPQGSYSVLYAAQSIPCAMWEGIVRNRFARRQRRILAVQEVAPLLAVTLDTLEPLALVDLRDDGPVRIGAPTAVTHDTSHKAGQALSAATYANVPEADGFLYLSRFTGHACVAVFDKAVDKLTVRDLTTLMQHPQFADMLVDYEIALQDTSRG